MAWKSLDNWDKARRERDERRELEGWEPPEEVEALTEQEAELEKPRGLTERELEYLNKFRALDPFSKNAVQEMKDLEREEAEAKERDKNPKPEPERTLEQTRDIDDGYDFGF